MIRQCPHCQTSNRVPVKYLASRGRCGACRNELPALAEPLDVNEAEFDAVLEQASVPVLVDFWAPWCGPCKMAAPEVSKTAAALQAKALVLKVNTEQNPGLAARYAVRSIPYFAVFLNGSLRQQQAGLVGSQQLIGLVQATG